MLEMMLEIVTRHRIAYRNVELGIDRVTVYWAEDGDAKGWCYAAWCRDEHDSNGEFGADDGAWWDDPDAEDAALECAAARWPETETNLGNPDYV